MESERKSKLMHSYIYEDDDIEIEDDGIEIANDENQKNEEEIKIVQNNSFTDPLITNDNNRNSNKSNRGSRGKFTGENIEEKKMLYDMGFKFQLINTIYNNMHPVDIQEALDYLNKNDKGKFTHSYLENDRFICAICSQGRDAHENTALFMENNAEHNQINSNTNNNTPNHVLELNVVSNENDNNNLNNNILNNNDNTIRTNSRNSIRYKRFEDSYLNILNKYNNYSSNKPKECAICGDEIEYPDSYTVKLPCAHYFCIECWQNYLKEKINNANVAKISCMQHGCSEVLKKEFIKKILNDDTLIQKYEKFLEKQNLLMSNKNIKFCPIPDCDGYAEKTKNKKYVKCNFGHDFCFECLKQPHGKQKCEDIIDKDFEEWKKHKIVKRCPNCKMWTEKNEGCNHMTCVECKFQWCWLCQKKYSSDHYTIGSCKGLQFETEQDEQKIKKMLENNLKKYPRPKPTLCDLIKKCLLEILVFLLFLFLLPYYFLFRHQERNHYLRNNCRFGVYMFSVIPAFICFEIFFLSINFVILIPGLIFSRYYRDLYHYVKTHFDF